MELNDRKEQFSDAYLQAVASVAGFGTYKPVPDVGLDWGFGIRGKRNHQVAPFRGATEVYGCGHTY